MDTELAKDVAEFFAINSAENKSGNPDTEKLRKFAQNIVRRHIGHFSEYFATHLSKITPEFRLYSSNGTPDFQFKDKGHAASSFRMAVTQSADDRLSSSQSIGIMCLYLYSLKMEPDVTEEESMALLLVLARRTYAYVSGVANMFIAEGGRKFKKSAPKTTYLLSSQLLRRLY